MATRAGAAPAGAPGFPIGVWMQSPTRAAAYRALGINTFVGLWEGPTEAQLVALAAQGMFAIAAQNEVALASPHAGIIRAWLQDDEPDNAQPIAPGLAVFSGCVPAAEVARRTRAMRARDPSRPVMINFGPGAADTTWPGRGRCTGDLGWYDTAIAGAGILSFDAYPVADHAGRMRGDLSYVGRGVTMLRRKAAPGQQVWAIIEASALDPARPPTPAELRAEIWMALVHGASGIVYFVHEFHPFREDGVFGHPPLVRALAAENVRLASLAPALSAASGPAVAVEGPARAIARVDGGVLHVFASGLQAATARVTMTIPGVGDAVAWVLDEDRSVTLRAGRLVDDFSAWGPHLYRIER